MGLLSREVSQQYRAFLHGEPSPLLRLPIQYADFAAWERERMTGETLRAPLAYWRARLAGAPPVLDLPHDRPRPALPSLRSGRGAPLPPRPVCGRPSSRSEKRTAPPCS